MTASRTINGVTLIPHPINGMTFLADRDGMCLGEIFAWRVSQPDGSWCVRLGGQVARKFPSEHAALAFLVGGCPECRCTPELCESDDTGQHCIDAGCGVCLNGCPEDVCDVLKEAKA